MDQRLQFLSSYQKEEMSVADLCRAFASELREEWSETVDECIGLLDSIEDHAEAGRRTLADLPLEKTVQMSGAASSLYQVTITSEPRSALLRLGRKLSKVDIRSTNGQCVGGAKIWPQPMSMADIDLQSCVFWHTACISGGEYSGSPRAKFLRGR